jgi:hypothetical protein
MVLPLDDKAGARIGGLAIKCIDQAIEQALTSNVPHTAGDPAWLYPSVLLFYCPSRRRIGVPSFFVSPARERSESQGCDR